MRAVKIYSCYFQYFNDFTIVNLIYPWKIIILFHLQDDFYSFSKLHKLRLMQTY